MQRSYYAVLPASVRYDEGLNASEKLFYAELALLRDGSGCVQMSSREIAEAVGASERTVRAWIADLRKSGHLVKEGCRLLLKSF